MFDREPPSEKERKKKMMAPCLLTEIKSEDEDAENFHESAWKCPKIFNFFERMSVQTLFIFKLFLISYHGLDSSW